MHYSTLSTAASWLDVVLPAAKSFGKILVSVSIIISTLNEASLIADAVQSARGQGALEVIVVDGGSTDGTRASARGADLVLETLRGRALQMNHAARVAQGDVLLFLHADCRLEERSMPVVERRLNRKDVAAACFRQRVQATGLAYRWIDLAAHVRVRSTGIVYGDQGLCVRREVFNALGGFPAVGFMEDVLFSRSLRRVGRVAILPKRILVSPRRWEREGIVVQTARNWFLLAQAAAGAPVDRLARHYPVVR